MSASYYFKCNKCQEIGGQYTRQMWGWGNFYVIATFKFLAYHTENCGVEHIGVVSENDIDADVFNPENDIKFLEKTKDYFPAFEKQYEGSDLNDIEETKAKWHKKAMEDAKNCYKACYKKDYVSNDEA
jgi:hypothetical protein